MNYLKKEKIISHHFFKTALVAAFILFVCLIPMPAEAKTMYRMIPNVDKWVHFFFFFGLSITFLFDYKFNNQKSGSFFKIALMTLLTVTLFGGLIEVLQAAFTARSASWFDFLSDFNGALTGLVILFLFKKTKAIRAYYTNKRNEEIIPPVLLLEH